MHSVNFPLSNAEALKLGQIDDLVTLTETAAAVRDQRNDNVVTFSKKVFLPLTQLCRDVCHYCTFAQTPKKLDAVYMSIESVLQAARQAERLGCKEALFTLGEKPELRYKVAREWLSSHGYSSTTQYLADAAQAVLSETDLLPHLNPGNIDSDDLAQLKTIAPSMGIMLESSAHRLTLKGMPHYGSPDKTPRVRLDSLRNMGQAKIPTTTGILIGIGETRTERIQSLLDLRDLHHEFGHIQEVIIQPFRAKAGTKMHHAVEPSNDDLIWTIAIARLIFGPSMSIQAPPNLSPGELPSLIRAGINDWGGVSPITPDFVNPEAPWPHLDNLAKETAICGKTLKERLTVYPTYIFSKNGWLDATMKSKVLKLIDSNGLARTDTWSPGSLVEPPAEVLARLESTHLSSTDLTVILNRVSNNEKLQIQDITRLFNAEGNEFQEVIQFANELRRNSNGDSVTYVVNRNINYTNICYFKCQFCAFSKGKLSENLRGRPYDLANDELQRRVVEAWDRGATEVCMQGGIHPDYSGEKYLDLIRVVKEAVPAIHIHAFSPLEIWQGAQTSDQSLANYLTELKEAGLSTLPGTAAEILDDSIRSRICPDKINTEQWLEVMETAHQIGLKSTATIMFGHIEQPIHWARHLVRIRELQHRTSGFTEFVPLPFIHQEAPMYLKGNARRGPTFREALLMYAVARIALYPVITNIQASWVKLGHAGVSAALNSGCNDLGGTLMNESISRAAGTSHGQETSRRAMEDLIRSAGRVPRQRTTLYNSVDAETQLRSSNALPLREIVNTPARKYERKQPQELIRNTIP